MDRLQRLKQETLDELTRDILPFWERRMQDGRGGFLGRIDGTVISPEDILAKLHEMEDPQNAK